MQIHELQAEVKKLQAAVDAAANTSAAFARRNAVLEEQKRRLQSTINDLEQQASRQRAAIARLEQLTKSVWLPIPPAPLEVIDVEPATSPQPSPDTA